MSLYEITQYEIHARTYRVEADSEAKAIIKLFNGEADPVNNGLEYIEVCEDLGLPTEEYVELSAELRSLGENVDDVIPSIGNIEQVNNNAGWEAL